MVLDFSLNVIQLMWDFGDGSPVVIAAPGSTTTHDYTADLTYTITLTVNGSDGSQATTTQMVTFP